MHLGRPVAAKCYLLATFRIVGNAAELKTSNQQLAARQLPGTGRYLDHVVITAQGPARR
ncbi:hypothetical protein LJ737_09040 [Hymenobacter sp. 15J16-1T3B]|uniref:hypothetical protein n=1 Tax=Hymenobacter sp. 15J16-1T3B TaxID=2886941 RepID=UPI001D1236ED|nr:hypothetical protein [Hymenobacter sp. 15J16-1T3B]MCC3157384.1 hypothetical protein [Hymenobacter sp. 15J16-1T3B]